MKLYKYILSSAAVVLGLSACNKESVLEMEQKAVEKFVPVTVGAVFTDTKTTMASNGDVLWSSSDKIKVQVGSNSYDFSLASGAGTASASFSAVVTESDAAILDGTAAGTVTAFYPTSGAEVPSTQTYAEGTFADGMNPMTATYADKTFSFTNDAAVVRVQGVSKDATSAVLSYSVDQTNYSVTMALTAGAAAKDLYFVVIPGASQFALSIDETAAVNYNASEATVAGSRYNLTAATPVAKIGEEEYYTLSAALNAAKEGEAVYIIPNQLEETVSASNNNNIQLIMDGKALIGDLTFGGSGTLIVRAEELNVNYYHSSNYSSKDDPTIPAKGAGGIMGTISTSDSTAIVMLRENLYSGPFEGNVELRGGFYNAELGLQTIKAQTPGGIGLVVEQTQEAFGYTLYYVPEVPESYLVHVPAEFLAAAIAGQLTYEQISYATLGYGLGDRIMNPWWGAYGDGVGAPKEKHFPDDVYAFFTNLKDGNPDNPKYEYQDWYCDFEISYSEPIANDYQSGIWGYYSDMCFGCWLPSSVTENPFGMMKDGLGGRWEYSRMLSQVGMFLCGPKNLNSADAGKVITVNLKIYPSKETTDCIITNKVVYTIPQISQ